MFLIPSSVKILFSDVVFSLGFNYLRGLYHPFVSPFSVFKIQAFPATDFAVQGMNKQHAGPALAERTIKPKPCPAVTRFCDSQLDGNSLQFQFRLYQVFLASHSVFFQEIRDFYLRTVLNQ